MTTNYRGITDAEVVEKLVDRMIEAGKPIGFDIESGYVGEDRKDMALLTYHPDWILVGFSFTNVVPQFNKDTGEWENLVAFYVPVAHDRGGNIDDEVRAARAMWRLVNSGLGVAHNAAFELNAMSRWFRDKLWDDPEVGAEVRSSFGFFNVKSDTQVEAHLLAWYEPKGPGGGVGVGLKELTKFIFKHTMVEFKSLFPEEDSSLGPGTKKSKMNTIRFNSRSAESQEIVNYASEDAAWCLALHVKHYPHLEESSIFQAEIKLLRVLAGMEYEGILLDWDYIHEKAEELAIFRDKMNEEILADLSERLGEVVSINIGSTKQLADLLFNRLELPVKMRSEKTGAPSTSEKALRSIAQEDSIVRAILRYREVVKLYGSYLHKYDVELNYDGTGRARPNHRSLGALTGRLSVDGVSYQQWPKPYHFTLKDGTEFRMNFRDLLLSPPGYRVVGYDWSQVELRVMAGLAGEKTMIEAFRAGRDIHKTTASAMMKIPYEEVTQKQRATGKTLNFAITYGSGPGNISEMLTKPDDPVSVADAKDLLKKYYAGFPMLSTWMEARRVEGRESHQVITPFGRHYTVWQFKQRQLPKNHDRADMLTSEGDRLCVNAVVQGGAADMLKHTMVNIHDIIVANGLEDKIKLVMTVHDALEFYVHESISTQKVIDLFKGAVSPTHPGFPEILAEWHEGKTWGTVAEVLTDENKKITGYEYEYKNKKYRFDSMDEAYEFIENPPIVDSIEEESTESNADSVAKIVVIDPVGSGDLQAHQMKNLASYLEDIPGPHTVRLDFKGQEHVLRWNVSLLTLDKTQISVILGGARVRVIAHPTDLIEELDI